MATLLGESLLAVTGVTAALRPGPIRITTALFARAEAVERQIRAKLRKFVREPAFAPFPDLPDFDFEEVEKLLPGAESEIRNVENVSGFQAQDLADDYADALGGAVAYIRNFLPAEVLPAMVGADKLRPADLDVSEFRRRYLVADQPLAMFDEMLAGPLMPDQVEAFAEIYPALYASAREAHLVELVDAAASKPDWRLPYVKDQVLKVFLQTETLDPALQTELSKAFEAARERESGQKADGTAAPKARAGIGDPSTQQERLETK